MALTSLHDWDGLKEELEALGRQEYRELVSRLGVREQRRAITRLLEQALDAATLCDTRGDWGEMTS